MCLGISHALRGLLILGSVGLFLAAQGEAGTLISTDFSSATLDPALVSVPGVGVAMTPGTTGPVGTGLNLTGAVTGCCANQRSFVQTIQADFNTFDWTLRVGYYQIALPPTPPGGELGIMYFGFGAGAALAAGNSPQFSPDVRAIDFRLHHQTNDYVANNLYAWDVQGNFAGGIGGTPTQQSTAANGQHELELQKVGNVFTLSIDSDVWGSAAFDMAALGLNNTNSHLFIGTGYSSGEFTSFTVTTPDSATPEPGSMILLGLGLAVLLAWRRSPPRHAGCLLHGR